jgi:TonB family protein
MNLERTGVSRSELGSLKTCLVEGDPDQERRASQGKRRAVLVSIVVPLLVLAALVVFPLLSKGEHITFERTPISPYSLRGSPDRPRPEAHPNAPRPACHFCAPVSPIHPTTTHDPTGSAIDPRDGDPPIVGGDPNGSPDGDPFVPSTNGPGPIIEDHSRDDRRTHRIFKGHIEPALLIQRVEPMYPRIGITLRHETHVELHAIISTDGSIQSLEVLSGDPLFYNSALDAVRQWRYRPTYRNSQPVEVDTHITVIYMLNHTSMCCQLRRVSLLRSLLQCSTAPESSSVSHIAAAT